MTDPSDPVIEVRRSARRKRTVSAYRAGERIIVLLPAHLSAAQERTFVDDLVTKVLAKEAQRAGERGSDLAARAAELSIRYLQPVLGRTPRPTEIRWVTNQQHRWGSCTPTTGVIRLSHRLQPLPAWVVDYVILHELVHLVEASHSPAFWRLVDRYPTAERAKGYLAGYSAGRDRPGDDLTDDLDGGD